MAEAPSEYDYLERGRFFYQRGMLAEAVSDFNQALEMEPSLAPAYYYRGLARRADGGGPAGGGGTIPRRCGWEPGLSGRVLRRAGWRSGS